MSWLIVILDVVTFAAVMCRKTAVTVRRSMGGGLCRTWFVKQAANLRLFIRGFQAALRYIKIGGAVARMPLVADVALNHHPAHHIGH